MTTSIMGSFHSADAFTVRTTIGVSSADFTVTAGTTFATADAVISAWNASLSGIGATAARVVNAANHTGFVQITTGGGAFDLTWSHAGDGSQLRDFLGSAGDLSSKASGYQFANPLAAAFFPSYDMRRIDMDAEPWDMQRMMTGSGAVTAQNPHSGPGSALRYSAVAEFWYGSTGANYKPHETLRDLIDGILEYGQPFTISTDSNTYECRLRASQQLEIIPEPVEDVQRGTLYRVRLPLTLEN